MELHEIMDEWLAACKSTTELTLSGSGMERAQIKKLYNRANISMPLFRLFGAGFLENVEKDLANIVNPATPALQRWSRTRRGQAGRRNLRSMMKIYCPELLNDFDATVSSRGAWVRENRKLIKRSLKTGEPPPELTVILSESVQTVTNLEHLKVAIAAVIRSKYPLGGTAAQE
ncbi:hypothetical protein [Streptomyces celluloflavus]|uniref:hypothetical protein n=1 Tax=Streptomyces celluloflavus TaxID=58344 RepID=UPI003675B6BE